MQNTSNNSYFITHNIETATNVVAALKDNNLTEAQIGVIGNRDTLAMTELPEADLTETSDVVQAAKRGASVGVTTGFLAGLAITTFPPAGVALGGTAVAAMSAGGAALGTWTATMIGVSEKSPLVEKFSNELENEAIIVVADIASKQSSIMPRVANEAGITDEQYGAL